MEKRATPIALASSARMHAISVEEALMIAEIANRAQGFGAGRTIWSMAETFGVPLTDVSWAMLDMVEHKPIVIVRAH